MTYIPFSKYESNLLLSIQPAAPCSCVVIFPVSARNAIIERPRELALPLLYLPAVFASVVQYIPHPYYIKLCQEERGTIDDPFAIGNPLTPPTQKPPVKILKSEVQSLVRTQ
jgi:hypothetical protein